MTQKLFKEPKYLIQIDSKYKKVELIKIFYSKFETKFNQIFITYWLYVYSFKSKKEELYVMFEKFNEFDKIFDTKFDADIYVTKFETEFEPYRKQICCKVKYNDLLMLKNNREFGKSDVRYFSKSADNWRHS
jgi:iron only hydrogenase large subunit-like protein